MNGSAIKIYDVFKAKFSEQESLTIVEEMEKLQDETVLDRIDARVSQAESTMIKWFFGVAFGQLILILTLMKLFLVK